MGKRKTGKAGGSTMKTEKKMNYIFSFTHLPLTAVIHG
jgi:hypothetical protein